MNIVPSLPPGPRTSHAATFDLETRAADAFEIDFDCADVSVTERSTNCVADGNSTCRTVALVK
jgi:hypothetical protein